MTIDPGQQATRNTSSIIAYLRLTRPANIVTAIADILAGFAISGAIVYHPDDWWTKLFWLIISTIGLYGGGVVFNDVFDAELDRKERPERPIPSGVATVTGASVLGALLLVLGVSAAAQVSFTSMFIAGTVAFLALFYDAIGKKLTYFGPLNMGLCRGGNLMLGVSAVIASVPQYWYMGWIPVLYIAAITMVSRGEVHGGNRKSLVAALVMYGIVIACIFIVSIKTPFPIVQIIPFLILFALMIFPPLIKALQLKSPPHIGKAVKAGVISLIIMDAAIAVSFAGWIYGLVILALWPISIMIAKRFAVT